MYVSTRVSTLHSQTTDLKCSIYVTDSHCQFPKLVDSLIDYVYKTNAKKMSTTKGKQAKFPCMPFWLFLLAISYTQHQSSNEFFFFSNELINLRDHEI